MQKSRLKKFCTAAFPASNIKVGTGAGDAMAGNTSIPGYSVMTQAEAETGTATAGRLITAKVLHDEIARQIAG